MKVLVMGNCQARPIADLISHMSREVEILGPIVVQRSNADSRPGEVDLVQSADVVLTQMIHNVYPAEHLRTREVKAVRRDGTVVTWPNLYFRGYNPELCYVRRPGRPTLVGPLGDYHLRTVIDAFLEGATVEEAKRRCFDPEFNAQRYEGVAAASLENLAKRGEVLDVCLASRVEELYRDRHLFYTFNHPSLELLVELAMVLLERLGLPVEVPVRPPMLPEPLGQYMLPLNVAFASSSRIEGPPSARTGKYRFTDGKFGHVPGYQFVRMDVLIEDFYRFYSDHCAPADFVAYERD